MTPFYDRLPNVAGFGVERTADIIGAGLAVGAVAGVAAHAAMTGLHQLRRAKQAEQAVSAPQGADVPPT
jgi:hydrogenase small subunit